MDDLADSGLARRTSLIGMKKKADLHYLCFVMRFKVISIIFTGLNTVV